MTPQQTLALLRQEGHDAESLRQIPVGTVQWTPGTGGYPGWFRCNLCDQCLTPAHALGKTHSRRLWHHQTSEMQQGRNVLYFSDVQIGAGVPPAAAGVPPAAAGVPPAAAGFKAPPPVFKMPPPPPPPQNPAPAGQTTSTVHIVELSDMGVQTGASLDGEQKPVQANIGAAM